MLLLKAVNMKIVSERSGRMLRPDVNIFFVQKEEESK